MHGDAPDIHVMHEMSPNSKLLKPLSLLFNCSGPRTSCYECKASIFPS